MTKITSLTVFFIILNFFYCKGEVPNPPKLLFPEQNLEIVYIYPQFIFSSVEGANLYRLEYSLDSEFVNAESIILTDTFYVGDQLFNIGANYYWRVRGEYLKDFNPGPWDWQTEWSDVYQFKTMNFKLGGTRFTKPEITYNISATSIFEWKKVDAATKYYLQFSSDKQFQNITYDTITALTDYTAHNLRSQREYSVRVRAQNGSDFGPWAKALNIKIKKQLIYGITKSEPTNESKNLPLSVVLKWKSYHWPGIIKLYHVKLWESDSQQIAADSVISGLELAVDKLKPGTYYEWQVRGISDQDTSYWGQSWHFRTIFDELPELPSKVILIEPKDMSILYESNGMPVAHDLDWAQAEPFVDKYLVEIASLEDFSNAVMDSMEYHGVNIRHMLDISYDTKYYWRVRAWNVAGWGPWSDTWRFLFQYVSVGDDELGSITLHPNPVDDLLYLMTNQNSKAISRVQIFDMMGVLRYDQLFGNSEIAINMREFPSGSYLLNIWSGPNPIKSIIIKN